MSTLSNLSPGAHTFHTSTGARLTYFVTGTGPHLLVNVAPGWGCASPLYQATFGFLEPGFTIAHLEVRGTRESSFPADPRAMSSWHMADDVESLRIHLGRDAFDGLVGHSNGGCIAIWYAARFPSRVKKLVLLGAQLLGSMPVSLPATKAILDVHPDKDAVAAFYSWIENIPNFNTDDEFAAGLSAFFALYVANPEKTLASVQGAFTNKPQLACMQAQAPAETEAQYADQTQELAKITASTLVLVGKDDFICPVAVSDIIATGIKGSRLHVVEDAGHFTWIEQKAECTRILGDFLKFFS